MKKIILASLSLSVLAFSGCGLTDDSLFSSHSGDLVTASGTKSEEYSASASPNIIEVSPTTAQISISGLSSGKTIWMTKTNPTKTGISAKYTRAVSSVSGLTTATGNATASSSSGGNLINTILGWFTRSASGEHYEGCLSATLNSRLDFSELANRSLAAGPAPSKAVTQINPVVNSTTKSIYIDVNSSMSKYEAKTATLRAKGEYCYVWVIGTGNESTYWTQGSASGEKINASIAQSVADNFDKIYPMVRKVFGEESDKILYQARYINDMSDYSNTGKMVNIVVYDIANDYNGEKPNGGTLGYFYAKDYYADYAKGVAAYSNKGKYFYIDAYYTANETATVYSTLAHEFQHMVDFGVKTMKTFEKTFKTSKTTLQSGSWYNEMKSMLCEDIMKDYLEANNSNFTDDDSPFQRLPMFCRHYYDTGLEYKESGTYDVYYSYANNYAFGAWAARTYGGVDFINKIATNDYVDIASITAASGTSISEMLKYYTAACLFQESNYGFNKKLTQTKYSSNGYSYPLEAIDLWTLNNVLTDSYNSFRKSGASGKISSFYSYDGPVYFGYNAQQDLRPYGFTLVKVGTANSSTITLKFNTSDIDNAQKTYIIIE
ncbi:hypothetical protein [uncultured Treponema sp.]|uniref:hypothetical protein n=1 Tax=uncultured Treponema sp. TaxID=162155 RepID=UPI0025E41561|nr:hypothetical protein [uncultured Treponema sp.]